MDRTALAACLQRLDSTYDAAACLLRNEVSSIGYHTALKQGTAVHSTRESLGYALLLVAEGSTPRLERAAAIVRRMVGMQITDPTDYHYGIWPWFAEESVKQMRPADFNWADFCGFRLIEIVHASGTRLPAELVGQVREAIGHAAWAIFRRNIQSGYTNIAAMGGSVCALAGELLDEPRLLAYGRQRLQHLAAYKEFSEYNSPNYGVVTIDVCERLLHLSRDEPSRAAALLLHHQLWAMIARHFHMPTGQWAGPHSRAYSDVLSPATAEFLSLRTGTAIAVHPWQAGPSKREVEVAPPLPCPDDLRQHFTQPPTQPKEFTERLIRDRGRGQSLFGTTWIGPQACLSTTSDESTWIQRHPILGYLVHPSHQCSILRVRIQRDGKDFASGVVRAAQRGPAAIVAAGLLTEHGDHHIHLDRPADGVFHCNDLRVRIELQAEDAAVTPQGDGLWQLSAGGRHVTVATGPAKFDGHAALWQPGRTERSAFIDAVWHTGSELMFNPAKLGTTFATLGLAIDVTTTVPVAVQESSDALQMSWPVTGDACVRAPLSPGWF